MLRRTFRAGNPPKLVLYGDWGGEDAHPASHGVQSLRMPEFPAMVVFVELPDITTRSTFQVAHAALLDALGFDSAKEWVRRYHTRHPENAQQLIRKSTQSGDIATAFENMLAPGRAAESRGTGSEESRSSAADARLGGPDSRALTQFTDFVGVLQMFGRMAREVEEELLVLMLDEATKLDL